MTILLNDILNLGNLSITKIRFVKRSSLTDPITLFKENMEELLRWQYWNYAKNKSFQKGQVTLGLVKIDDEKWLLFHIGQITKDLNLLNSVGYEYETLTQYEKYFGRIIVKYKNRSQQMVRRAESVINDCVVLQILEDTFDNDIFPGYENVNLSWNDLKRVLPKVAWNTALKNQKGVYLITDSYTGKMYVGSAYGDDMLYRRWSCYAETVDGGNVELRGLDHDYIRNNFRYSILDIYKSTIDDKVIIGREKWWKNTLMTRLFGYNRN